MKISTGEATWEIIYTDRIFYGRSHVEINLHRRMVLPLRRNATWELMYTDRQTWFNYSPSLKKTQ
jgi:hypothetical protein